MKSKSLLIALAFLALIIAACGPTPQELADEHHRLHQKLRNATNEDDSISIYKEIEALESKARSKLNKTEYKEYRKLVSDGDTEPQYSLEELVQQRDVFENLLKNAKTEADSTHFLEEIKKLEEKIHKIEANKDNNPE